MINTLLVQIWMFTVLSNCAANPAFKDKKYVIGALLATACKEFFFFNLQCAPHYDLSYTAFDKEKTSSCYSPQILPVTKLQSYFLLRALPSF